MIRPLFLFGGIIYLKKKIIDSYEKNRSNPIDHPFSRI